MSVSLCIPAYNEESNIKNLIDSVFEQTFDLKQIKDITIVASGCTDNTEKIVKEYQKKHPLLKLISQNERKGKSSAINAFLQTTTSDICVLISADLILTKNCLNELLKPFENSHIGLTGGHPIPQNPTKGLSNFAVHTLWELHHQLALINPKCGEIIAFRRVFSEISEQSPVDEASIEELITKQSLQITYCPKAIVHNQGPTTINEFIKQRRRINYGHIWLTHNTKYQPSTTNYFKILQLILKKFSFNLIHNLRLITVILLEILSKLLAIKDWHTKKHNYTIWEQIKTTKNLNTKSSLKIATIYPYHLPTLGGVETYIKNLTTELTKKNLEIAIFTADQYFKNHEKIPNQEYGYPIYYLPNHKLLNYLIPTRKAFQKLKEFNPNIIHINHPHPFGTISLLFLRKYRKKIVLTYHADVNPSSLLIKLFAFFEKQLYRFLCAEIIVTTEKYKELISKIFPKKFIEVIELASNLLPIKTLCFPFGASFAHKKSQTVLFVGALDSNHQYKDLNTLIACAEITPNVEYQIVGSGNLQSTFENLVHRKQLTNIKFLGKVPNEKLPEIYQNARITILPAKSNSEGFGIVLLESMSQGTPVITTNVVGSSDLIKKHGCGLIIPPQNPAELKKAIEQIFTTPELEKKLIVNGLQLTKELTWAKVAEKTLHVYEQVAQRTTKQA